MRSATSFFDKTMIRTDVRRFWPLWVLYTGIWVIMLPVYQWVDLYLSVDYPGDQVYNSLMGGLVMAVAFGCLLPMAAKAVKLDPAVMASPFISTIVDALSLLVYFLFAKALLGV